MPVKVKVDTKELSKFFKKLGKNIPDWVERGLQGYALELERKIVEEINFMGLNYNGAMRKSVTHFVWRELTKTFALVGTSIQKPFPYPVSVHEGTKPHWPPVDVLRLWVRKKLNVNENEVNRVAYLVGRKISIHGTPPNPFIRNVFLKNKGKMSTRIVAHIARIYGQGKVK